MVDKITPEQFLETMDRKVVAQYLIEGGDINVKDQSERTILHRLTETNQGNQAEKLQIIQYLLRQGAEVKALDKGGRTPLHYAAFKGQVDAIKLLIEKGADVKAADKTGTTPLHDAAWNGQVDAIKLLIEKGADVNAVAKYDGGTPLHEAAVGVNMAAIKLLIEKGADIKAVDKTGSTPLHAAARHGNVEAMKLLIEKDAPLGAKNTNGKTPLNLLEEALKDKPAELEKAKKEIKESVLKAIEMSKTDAQRKSAYDSLALFDPAVPAGSSTPHGLAEAVKKHHPDEKPTLAV